jgi:Flp pilus assembly protein TadG
MRAERRAATGRRTGASAAEFAIILPILLLIVLGCVDFGRFAYYYVTVTNAGRAGGQYAMMTPCNFSDATAVGNWKNQIQATARNEFANQSGTDTTKLTIATTVYNDEGNGLRRVQIQTSYASFQTLMSWPGIPGSTTLRSSVVVRMIR